MLKREPISRFGQVKWAWQKRNVVFRLDGDIEYWSKDARKQIGAFKQKPIPLFEEARHVMNIHMFSLNFGSTARELFNIGDFVEHEDD